MPDEPVGSEEEPLSLPQRVGFGLALVVILVGALYLLLHMSVRPINPKQETPEDHFTWQCSLCHNVSASEPLVKK